MVKGIVDYTNAFAQHNVSHYSLSLRLLLDLITGRKFRGIPHLFLLSYFEFLSQIARINQNAQRNLVPGQPPPKLKVWKAVDEVEMRAFIGLLIIAGVKKHRRYPIRRMWSTNGKWRQEVAAATMGRDRFQAIMKYLRFDDAVQRHANIANNVPVKKLEPIRDLFHAFVRNLQTLYEPGTHLTVSTISLNIFRYVQSIY